MGYNFFFKNSGWEGDVFGELREVEEREWNADMIMTQSAYELPPIQGSMGIW